MRHVADQPENKVIECLARVTGGIGMLGTRPSYEMMRAGMPAAHSGGLASMGAAVPYAIAAKFAYRERPAMAFVGDDAMQMNGLNELITVAEYWQQWEDPRFIVFVLNNRDLNMVTWEECILEGDPKFPASQDLPDFSYAAYAHLLGFDGFVIDEARKIVPTLEFALASRRPAMVEIVADPNIPPLPPHTPPGRRRTTCWR